MSTDGRRFQGFTFFPDKWEADTTHLSAEAYRAYHKILCFMWRKGREQCAIRNTDEALSVAISRRKTVVRKVMSEIQNPECPLLQVEGDWLVSRGLRKEYERAVESSGKGTTNAEKRWKTDDAAMLRSNATQHPPGIAPIPIPSNPKETDTSPRSRRTVHRPRARVDGIEGVGSILEQMTEHDAEVSRLTIEFRKYLRRPAWDEWLRHVILKLFQCGGAAAGLDLDELVREMAKTTDPRRARDTAIAPIRDYESVVAKRITGLCKRYGAKPWPNFPGR